MFTHGGQVDLHTFMGMRGGGGKGGGGQQQQAKAAPPQYVDPEDGMVFTDGVDSFGMPALAPGAPTAADRYNAHRKTKADNAATKATTDAATAATTATNNQNTWNTSRDTAYNDALEAVQRTFRTEGLDPATYMTSDIAPRLNQQKNSIANLSANPSSAFSPTLGKDIIGDLTSGRRTQVNNELNTLFSPTYANDLLPDSSMDASVQSILSEQFDPLGTQLQAAKARRTLDDTGYDAAVKALGAKRTTAQSSIGSLGRNILGADRSAVNDIVGGARSTAAGLGLGQQFDPKGYDTQARARANQEIGSFGGELRGAVGDTKYADFTELLNAGGVAQGATNPADGGLGKVGTSPFYKDPEEEANKGRGLGSTGAF